MSVRASQSIAALRSGRHALREVPAATTLDDCWALGEAAAASRCMDMVAERVCFMPPDLMVRHMVGMYWAFRASSSSCMRLMFSSALSTGPRIILVPWCPMLPAGAPHRPRPVDR
jgi:hypothetical protein